MFSLQGDLPVKLTAQPYRRHDTHFGEPRDRLGLNDRWMLRRRKAMLGLIQVQKQSTIELRINCDATAGVG
jgi:hypothetical protein